MQPIQSVGIPPLPPTWSPSAGSASSLPTAGPSFKEMLLESLERARATQHQAPSVQATAAGAGGTQPAELLNSLHKAEHTLKTMTQVRDHAVAAYQEIKNLQI